MPRRFAPRNDRYRCAYPCNQRKQQTSFVIARPVRKLAVAIRNSRPVPRPLSPVPCPPSPVPRPLSPVPRLPSPVPWRGNPKGEPGGSPFGREERVQGEPFGRFPLAVFLSPISFWRAKRNGAAGGTLRALPRSVIKEGGYGLPRRFAPRNDKSCLLLP